MKALSALAAAAAMLAVTPAFADPATIVDFEGVTSFSSIADYYNGGTDSAGASGSNLGVSFTGAALALSNDELGPYFSNAPTAGTVMFATDATAVMNFAQGFVTDMSFYYSAASAALSAVTIYSGLNGTGAILGTFDLAANAQSGCNDTAFCNWQLASLAFSGIAQSASFGGNFGQVAFDNLTVTTVPEPQAYAMMLLGLAGVAVAVRRRRKG